MSNEDEIESLGFDPDVTGNIGGRLEFSMSGRVNGDLFRI